ncbi:MAG TPA: signal peptidase II, partial [Hyphomonas sp.]|nr:signal peptidase II [Hyphomonas sp.]
MTIQKIGFIIGLGVLAIDQLTKALILNIDALDNGVTVLPFFNIVRLKNNGISFGLLGSLPPWLLTLAALSIVAVLFYWLWRTADRQIATALGLITGGALGNIVDRVRHGAVTDFLDFHINNYHWPAFNFAD